MLPLLIIKTGETFPQIRSEHGDFEDWIRICFEGSEITFKIHDVQKIYPYPEPADLSGIIITGSHAMVTEPPAWYDGLVSWIKRAAAQRHLPILGICFGHQLLADAFGGKVDYNVRGREIGTRPIDVTPAGIINPLFNGLPPGFMAQESHAQEVTKLPPEAIHLATNDHAAVQAFHLPPGVWGIQFHPEFSSVVMSEYVNLLRDQITAEGLDPDKIRSAVQPAPHAKMIFLNFIKVIETGASR